MELSNKVYSIKGRGKKKFCVINYNFKDKFNTCLDATGMIWVDSKYNFLKTLMISHDSIVTDQDLLGCDDYIENIMNDTIVHAVFTNTTIGCSKLRLKRMVEKLKSRGIKVKYYASLNSFNLKTDSNLEIIKGTAK